jgi:predicted metal-dependent enzyme (double-stranded beta helix superfamily)
MEKFIEDCREALGEADARQAVDEIVQRLLSSPSKVVAAVGESKLAGIETLYHASDLTIVNIAWAPGMTLYPHNHNMWAVIGIYGGREDNTFYRRRPGGLVRHGLKALESGQSIALGKDIIHSVHNPLGKMTLGLHVYGGDFFGQPRSEWNPETLQEQPFDIENARATFERANQALNT